MEENNLLSKGLVSDIKSIIENGRNQVYAAINVSMLNTYWNVGRRIVEEEQHGEKRAEYGEFLAHKVADALKSEYGNTFSYRNICYFRQFYLCFNDIEIVNARVHNLTWTHIRHLLRVSDSAARMWYLQEASSQMWSTRELERNILSQYYYRLLANQKDKAAPVADIHSSEPALPEKEEFIKNPVVAEFLGLKADRNFDEKKLEEAIIRHIEYTRHTHWPSQIIGLLHTSP